MQPALGLPQQLRGRQDLPFALGWIGFAKHRGDELLDFLRSCLLGQRHSGLPRHHTRADEDCREYRSGGTDRERVPRDELADAIPETVRLREHRSRT